MHVGRLLARLNPKNARFDIGSGGESELTPQDIAAALGMVRNVLGRELLCLVWWPKSTQVSLRQLDAALEQAQRAEWWKREGKMLDAMLAVAAHTGGHSLRQAQRHYADAHAARWPHWVDSAELGTLSPGYGRVRLAALSELRAPNQCPHCFGHGTVTTDRGVVIPCDACGGSGRQTISNRTRARLLDIDESTYRRKWQRVFEWTLELCVDAMAEADRQMRNAVS